MQNSLEANINDQPKKGKLLFISGYFPPVNLSTGSVRPWNIAKYLTHSGWQVDVVMPHVKLWRPEVLDFTTKMYRDLQNSEVRVIYSDHWFKWLANSRLQTWDSGPGWLMGGTLRRLSQAIKLDSWIGWYYAALKLLSSYPSSMYDAILASGPPFTAFRIGAFFAEKWNKPLFLDYRDLWTGEPHTPAISKSDTRFERECLKQARGVTVVSASIGKSLIKRFALDEKKLRVVTNGFDPDDVSSITPTIFDTAALVYAGNFSPPVRTLQPILRILEIIRQDAVFSSNFKFHYYGFDTENYGRNSVNKCGLEPLVEIHGRVKREEALSAVKGASVALVITSTSNNPTPDELGIVTGKIFEMIGMGVPTMVIAPHGSDIYEIVERSGIGKCFSPTDTIGMVKFIQQVLQKEFVPNVNGKIYSWPSLIATFEQLLLS